MNVLAVMVSDIHLSRTAPVSRSAEPDWYEAQGRMLDQVQQLIDQHGCPAICSGDLFDRWDASPELINWTIDHIPRPMYTIPGQHDLPLHNYADIHRSAYWTLAKVGAISDLGAGGDWTLCEDKNGRMLLASFPWGSDIRNVDAGVGDLKIAVIHRYVWKQGASYDDPPPESRYHHLAKSLEGYDVAVFGDNHIGFQVNLGNTRLVNCGCLIPRKSDERKLKPSAWLLMDDGTVERKILDCSQDKWLEQEEVKAILEPTGMDEFLEGLKTLDHDSLDFREAVTRYVSDSDNKVSKAARKILLELVEG